MGADKSFTVTWKPCVNVTGYEVEISYGGDTELHRVAGTTLEIKQFKGGKLKNGDTYGVRVQSVNGTWLSGLQHGCGGNARNEQKAGSPENIKAAGGYRRIRISWKNMKDTESYRIFYKEEGTDKYIVIDNIEGTNYVIEDLKDKTRYDIYMTGVNALGKARLPFLRRRSLLPRSRRRCRSTSF